MSTVHRIAALVVTAAAFLVVGRFRFLIVLLATLLVDILVHWKWRIWEEQNMLLVLLLVVVVVVVVAVAVVLPPEEDDNNDRSSSLQPE